MDTKQDAAQITKSEGAILAGGNLPDFPELQNCKSFSEIPEDVARRMLRSMTSILNGLEEYKALKEKQKSDTKTVDNT